MATTRHYVEEIDLKSARFCQECLSAVRESGAGARLAALGSLSPR
jgi:predicted Zn-dependent protease